VDRAHTWALLAGFVAALALAWFVAALRGAWRRHRVLARVRHGHAGERRGRALLERAGWRVLAAHPPGELRLLVDGEEVTQPLAADYLCERDGRVLPAEVKTGASAAVAAPATRRQLLEYATAYRSGAALFVDADDGTVSEVSFAAAPVTQHRRSGALALAFVVGATAGLAAGYAVWGAVR
jgi:hypothetical protein